MIDSACHLCCVRLGVPGCDWVRLPAQVRVEVGWGGKVPGVSVFRGPVLFALPLTEEYKCVRRRDPSHHIC